MQVRRILTLITFTLITAAAFITPGAEASVEIKRRVLALYKSSEGDSPSRSQTLELLEQPLETLGLVVDYKDAEAPLPADEEMQKYRGVVTFFRTSQINSPQTYISWMSHQIKQGRKYVVFGEFGAFEARGSRDFISHDTATKAFGALGLQYDGFDTEDQARIAFISADSNMMSFEEPFSAKSAPTYILIRSLNDKNIPYVTLERKDIPNSRSTPVIATPQGGFAARDYLLYEYKQGEDIKQRWHLNPYAFLKQTLGLQDDPAFSASSLNGRRLWMAHIDGDGFISGATSNILCGQAILDSILSVYKLPISVSIITDDLTRDPRAINLAKKIFALSHVEAASHSHSHPMDWRAPGVNIEQETTNSIQTLNQKVLSENKKVKLFTWPGLCNPTEAAIRAVAALKVAAINGINGDDGFVNRFDDLYPSRTNLAPATRHVGQSLQFTHRAANDYALTDEWAKKKDGFKNILATFENTRENPEIPAHLYFHFYSGQTPVALQSLARTFDWALQQPLSRIFVSDYIGIVEDFRTARLIKEDDGRVRVLNNGLCRTVIFPNESKQIDLAKSENVLGAENKNGTLVVYLDENKTHVIALSEQVPANFGLVSATGWIEKWSTEKGLSFVSRGYGPMEIALTAPSGFYKIQAGSRVHYKRAGKDGLSFTFTGSGNDEVVLTRSNIFRATARWMGKPLIALTLAAFPLLFFIRLRRESLEQ